MQRSVSFDMSRPETNVDLLKLSLPPSLISPGHRNSTQAALLVKSPVSWSGIGPTS